jgi:hypothetical protein
MPIRGPFLTLNVPGFRFRAMAIDDASSPAEPDEIAAGAASDPQHSGDILGAFGTLKREARNDRSWRRKIRFLLVIMGPGLIVMGGGNDAGGVQV